MNQPMYDRLIDPVCGVITDVSKYPPLPGDPPAYRAYTTLVSQPSRLGPWQADPVSLGVSFTDDEAARRAAIGEAVERYCGNFVPADRLTRLSPDQARRQGRKIVDPGTLVLFSDAQYDVHGFPCVRFSDDLPVLWTPGRLLNGGEEILVPGSLVWVNWWDGPRAGEPRTNYVPLAGVAAGVSMPSAVEAAITELVERDAVALWWHAGIPAPRVDLDHPALIAAMRGLTDEISTVLLTVPNRFGVPVMVAILEDREHGFPLLGAACRADPVEAALKALAEAIHLRRLFEDRLDPAGLHWRAAAAGELHRALAKNYREDRQYLDDFRPDFSDVLDLGHHALIHLDPRARPLWQQALTQRTAARTIALDDIETTQVTSALTADGWSPIVIDLTTADIAAAGLSVVRVVVPGLIPNSPAGIPHLGTDRLRHESYERGWTTAPLAESELLRFPMPHV